MMLMFAQHICIQVVVTRDELTECNTEEEEKDQLSPISVMDFPYEEEEEEEEETVDEGISDSSSFQENLASIESTFCSMFHSFHFISLSLSYLHL